MAPPPSPDLPISQRLWKLVQTLQFAWFFGHLVLIAAVGRYLSFYLTMKYFMRGALISYRGAFLSAAATYGIVVYKTWRARQKTKAQQSSSIQYIADENVQYLVMALVWLYMPQYPIAMLPYTIYSFFHVATYTRTNLIPTLFASTKSKTGADVTSPGGKAQYQHPAAEAIGVFVKRYYDTSMSMVATLEIVQWFRVLFSAILFQQRSWILLVVYTAFLRSRLAQNPHVQNSVWNMSAYVDNLVGNQGTPPAVRQFWEATKTGARQMHAATDIHKMVDGAAAPKKAE